MGRKDKAKASRVRGHSGPLTSLQQRREDIVLHHMEREEAGDEKAVADTFHSHRYDLVAVGRVLTGEEGVRSRVRELVETMPGLRVELVSLRHCEDAVIVETRATGKHTAELFGIAPTGKRYSSRGTAIFRFEDDRLMEEIVYYDRLTIIEQLS